MRDSCGLSPHVFLCDQRSARFVSVRAVGGPRLAGPWLALVGLLAFAMPSLAHADDGPLSELGVRVAMGATTFRPSADDRMIGVEANGNGDWAVDTFVCRVPPRTCTRSRCSSPKWLV